MSFQEHINEAIKDQQFYNVGDQLPSDWHQAFKYWSSFAEKGDPKAQFNIGTCYSNGNGVVKNSNAALLWFIKAAGQGEPRSYYGLYAEYSNRESQRFNESKAKDCLDKGVALNEPMALTACADKLLYDWNFDDARKFYKRAAEGGNRRAMMGIIVCDFDVYFTIGQVYRARSYVQSVSALGYGSNLRVSDGGTAWYSNFIDTINIKIVSKSTELANLNPYISMYENESRTAKVKSEEHISFRLEPNTKCKKEKIELYEANKIIKMVAYVEGYKVSVNGSYCSFAFKPMLIYDRVIAVKDRRIKKIKIFSFIVAILAGMMFYGLQEYEKIHNNDIQNAPHTE